MKSVALPQDAIQIEDRWYVLATSARAEPARVLKHGESFALFDRQGDVPRVGSGEHGLYHQGTRYLSCHELRVNGQRPLVLNSSVRRDNAVLAVDATNPDLLREGEPDLLKGTVHVARARTLSAGATRWRSGYRSSSTPTSSTSSRCAASRASAAARSTPRRWHAIASSSPTRASMK
jgi:glycogen debranching enzyme